MQTCKDCKQRRLGCHSTCDCYKEQIALNAYRRQRYYEDHLIICTPRFEKYSKTHTTYTFRKKTKQD